MRRRDDYPQDVVVETYRPTHDDTHHGNRGLVRLRLHAAKNFSMDDTSPSLTSLWRVTNVHNQQEAFAAIIEAAAGMTRDNVQNIIGHAARLLEGRRQHATDSNHGERPTG